MMLLYSEFIEISELSSSYELEELIHIYLLCKYDLYYKEELIYKVKRQKDYE